MAIQNGCAGHSKLRKYLQYVMIRGQDDVKKSHPVWYLMPVWLLQSTVTNPSWEYNPMIGN